MSAPRIFTAEYYARMRELEAGSWWNAAMRDVAGMLLADASLPEKGRVLDLGCGSGQTLAWFSRMLPQWETVGCDIALDAVAVAREFADAAIGASALDLPFPDASVDLIITLDVVQHLPIPGGDVRALGEIHRVLRPGGYVFLRTNAQSYPVIRDDLVFNFHKYTPNELREKLERAGLPPVRLSRLNALLGLAEIPRELRARRADHSAEYRGILAEARPEPSLVRALKRGWLKMEGRAVRYGMRLPAGRTIVALCRRDSEGK
jgi:SAM-dependent methyltransferase